MAGTERSVLMVNISGMEQKKENNSQARIEIIEFGPIKITGNFQLKDVKRDKEESPQEVFLCRCGNSANKPFCDESHKK
jgi:hypothetical protein